MANLGCRFPYASCREYIISGAPNVPSELMENLLIIPSIVRAYNFPSGPMVKLECRPDALGSAILLNLALIISPVDAAPVVNLLENGINEDPLRSLTPLVIEKT